MDPASYSDLTSEERREFGEMSKAMQLARILVIDPNPAIARLLTSHIAAVWPEVKVIAYDPSLGIPDNTYEWGDYDMVFLEEDLSCHRAEGLEWLYVLRATPDVPPIVMMASAAEQDLVVQAAARGAMGVVDKDKLSARVLVETVVGCLGRNGNPANSDATVRLNMSTLGSGDIPEPDSSDAAPIPKNVIERPAITENPGHQDSGVLDDGLIVEIPGYVIERRIARGNMGEVYLARGHDDSELLALKILRFENEQNRETIQRFLREYQFVSQISNPHVITVHERGFGSNFAFIAMEYCEYGNLKTKLRSPISPERALFCLRQIASGLGAAHKIGVLHRDIKPANILFRDPDTLVLTDFGVAKNLGNTASLTMTNSIIGSLYYVSPEQITEDACGPLSDLYSLGVVLYEMLAATLPFNGKSVADIMEAHCKTPIPRLSGESQDLQPLVDGLLAKKPDERFQSVADLIAGIDWVAESMGLR